MELFLPPKNLINFLKPSILKKLKTFYTLEKNPLRETGCLSNRDPIPEVTTLTAHPICTQGRRGFP